MRKTKEEAELTRKQILKASRQLFAKDGYSGTRLEEIARRAGVTRGAIYWHFGDKYKLFVNLLAESFAAYDGRIQTIVQSDDTPFTKIRKMIREPLISIINDKAYRDALDLYIYKAEFNEERAQKWLELKKEQSDIVGIAEANTWFVETFNRLITEGIEASEIKPETNPQLASFAIFSYLNGLQGQLLVLPKQYLVESVVDALVDFILNPLKK